MRQTDDPHDDCTHWIGSLPEESSHHTKRIDKRSVWWQFKPDILSEELGVEEER